MYKKCHRLYSCGDRVLWLDFRKGSKVMSTFFFIISEIAIFLSNLSMSLFIYVYLNLSFCVDGKTKRELLQRTSTKPTKR